MKKSLLIIFLSCSFITVFSQQQKWFTVKAFLPRWNGAEISLFSNNQLLHVSTVVKDMFDFTGVIDIAAQGSLKVRWGKSIFFIPVFFEPGTIRIRDAGSKVLVSYGTPSNDLYFQINRNFDSVLAQQKNLSFSEAINYKRELAAAFIRNNTSSIVSVQLLKDYFYMEKEASDTVYYSLIHSLDTILQQTFYVKEMKKEADARYITAVGNPAPFLQIADSCGRTISLYTTGQYTLLDFWASWCAPCRKENAALLQVYKKYASSGFRITGISLDENKMLWLKAIKQDKLLWPQLCDLKGWESSTAQVYGVKAIPMNYLINRDGVIVAKNLHVAQLDAILATVF